MGPLFTRARTLWDIVMARTWDRTTARAAIVRIHTLSFINLDDDVQHGIEINRDCVAQESSWVFCLFTMVLTAIINTGPGSVTPGHCVA